MATTKEYAYFRLFIGEANEDFRYSNILVAFHNAAGKRLGVAKLRSNIPITNAEQMIEDAWQRVKARMEQQTEAPKPTTGRSKADNTEQDEDAPF